MKFGNQQEYNIDDIIVVRGKPLHSGGRIGVITEKLPNEEYNAVFSPDAMFAGYQLRVTANNLRLASPEEIRTQILNDAASYTARMKHNKLLTSIIDDLN
jgi:hypothetical protein